MPREKTLIPERNYKILLDTREQFYNFDLQKYLTAKRQVVQTLCYISANFKAIFKPVGFIMVLLEKYNMYSPKRLPLLTPQTRPLIGSKDHKPSYLYTILFCT